MAVSTINSGGLPKRRWIKLLEFTTCVLDGVARDERAVMQALKEQAKSDFEKWGCHSGPQWLVEYLQLIMDGPTKYPRVDSLDDDGWAEYQPDPEQAQRWLDRHGGSAEDALGLVRQELNIRNAQYRRRSDLLDFMFDRAAPDDKDSRVVLMGKRKQRGGKRSFI